MHEKTLDKNFDLWAADLVQLYIERNLSKDEGKLKKSVHGYPHILVNAIQSLLFNNQKTVKNYKNYEKKKLFKKYKTKLRMPQFRGCKVISLQHLAIVDTALSHDSEQVLSHYAVRRDSSQLKDFILTYSHSVYLIITTDRQDKVIQSSLNGAKVHELSIYHSIRC